MYVQTFRLTKITIWIVGYRRLLACLLLKLPALTTTWLTNMDIRANTNLKPYTGWLRVKGRGPFAWGRAWSRKYFVSRGGGLSYFDDAHYKASHPLGTLDLRNGSVAVKRHSKYPHYFEVRGQEAGHGDVTWSLCSANVISLVEWVTRLSTISSTTVDWGYLNGHERKKLQMLMSPGGVSPVNVDASEADKRRAQGLKNIESDVSDDDDSGFKPRRGTAAAARLKFSNEATNDDSDLGSAPSAGSSTGGGVHDGGASQIDSDEDSGVSSNDSDEDSDASGVPGRRHWSLNHHHKPVAPKSAVRRSRAGDSVSEGQGGADGGVAPKSVRFSSPVHDRSDISESDGSSAASGSASPRSPEAAATVILPGDLLMPPHRTPGSTSPAGSAMNDTRLTYATDTSMLSSLSALGSTLGDAGADLTLALAVSPGAAMDALPDDLGGKFETRTPFPRAKRRSRVVTAASDAYPDDSESAPDSDDGTDDAAGSPIMRGTPASGSDSDGSSDGDSTGSDSCEAALDDAPARETPPQQQQHHHHGLPPRSAPASSGTARQGGTLLLSPASLGTLDFALSPVSAASTTLLAGLGLAGTLRGDSMTGASGLGATLRGGTPSTLQSLQEEEGEDEDEGFTSPSRVTRDGGGAGLDLGGPVLSTPSSTTSSPPGPLPSPSLGLSAGPAPTLDFGSSPVLVDRTSLFDVGAAPAVPRLASPQLRGDESPDPERPVQSAPPFSSPTSPDAHDEISPQRSGSGDDSASNASLQQLSSEPSPAGSYAEVDPASLPQAASRRSLARSRFSSVALDSLALPALAPAGGSEQGAALFLDESATSTPAITPRSGDHVGDCGASAVGFDAQDGGLQQGFNRESTPPTSALPTALYVWPAASPATPPRGANGSPKPKAPAPPVALPYSPLRAPQQPVTLRHPAESAPLADLVAPALANPRAFASPASLVDDALPSPVDIRVALAEVDRSVARLQAVTDSFVQHALVNASSASAVLADGGVGGGGGSGARGVGMLPGGYSLFNASFASSDGDAGERHEAGSALASPTLPTSLLGSAVRLDHFGLPRAEVATGENVEVLGDGDVGSDSDLSTIDGVDDEEERSPSTPRPPVAPSTPGRPSSTRTMPFASPAPNDGRRDSPEEDGRRVRWQPLQQGSVPGTLASAEELGGTLGPATELNLTVAAEPQPLATTPARAQSSGARIPVASLPSPLQSAVLNITALLARADIAGEDGDGALLAQLNQSLLDASAGPHAIAATLSMLAAPHTVRTVRRAPRVPLTPRIDSGSSSGDSGSASSDESAPVQPMDVRALPSSARVDVEVASAPSSPPRVAMGSLLGAAASPLRVRDLDTSPVLFHRASPSGNRDGNGVDDTMVDEIPAWKQLRAPSLPAQAPLLLPAGMDAALPQLTAPAPAPLTHAPAAEETGGMDDSALTDAIASLIHEITASEGAPLQVGDLLGGRDVAGAAAAAPMAGTPSDTAAAPASPDATTAAAPAPSVQALQADYTHALGAWLDEFARLHGDLLAPLAAAGAGNGSLAPPAPQPLEAAALASKLPRLVAAPREDEADDWFGGQLEEPKSQPQLYQGQLQQQPLRHSRSGLAASGLGDSGYRPQQLQFTPAAPANARGRTTTARVGDASVPHVVRQSTPAQVRPRSRTPSQLLRGKLPAAVGTAPGARPASRSPHPTGGPARVLPAYALNASNASAGTPAHYPAPAGIPAQRSAGVLPVPVARGRSGSRGLVQVMGAAGDVRDIARGYSAAVPSALDGAHSRPPSASATSRDAYPVTSRAASRSREPAARRASVNQLASGVSAHQSSFLQQHLQAVLHAQPATSQQQPLQQQQHQPSGSSASTGWVRQYPIGAPVAAVHANRRVAESKVMASLRAPGGAAVRATAPAAQGPHAKAAVSTASSRAAATAAAPRGRLPAPGQVAGSSILGTRVGMAHARDRSASRHKYM